MPASIANNNLVSIIIPCRNEERFIEKCLASVLAFEKPEGLDFEILAMDGRSSDRTVELATAMARQHPQIKVIDNPGLIQSTAVNLGVRASQGAWIMRLDAHAEYPANYLKLCHETALRSGADNVGGLFITQPGGSGYSAQLVQALTTHKFGVGDSGFRTGAKEDWADTVPYGYFRREVFDRLGWLDDRLVRAQDYEFNRRIIVSGGKILRNPLIHIKYYNQPTVGKFLRKQIEKEAPYNAYLWYLAPYAFAPRHAITGVFAMGVLGGLTLSPFTAWIGWPFAAVMALYALLAVLSGLQQAIRYKKPAHALLLPFCFFLYHFVHGLGVLIGLARLLTHTAPVQKANEPWPGAGRYRAWPQT
ncbi:MAG: glycosyltransferase family 2 protein [Sphingomonadales bacterium]|nr:glycosyltransferase family 2 protein [Sphingomonadales bacterium]